MQRFSSAKTCASKDLWAKWIQNFNCRRCFSPILKCFKCNYWHKSSAKRTNQWKMTTYLKTLCVVRVGFWLISCLSTIYRWFPAQNFTNCAKCSQRYRFHYQLCVAHKLFFFRVSNFSRKVSKNRNYIHIWIFIEPQWSCEWFIVSFAKNQSREKSSRNWFLWRMNNHKGNDTVDLH